MADNKKIQYKAGVLGGVTQEQADKKNAELNTPTPTTPQTAPQPTSLSQSSVAALLEANNARMAQKQAEVQAYQEAENKRVQALKDLRAKKGSFIGNYLASAEPKIDKAKEKRLQQVAKMKLLHDGLSALAKAYPAFIGKNAMGYYPTSTPSKIGKDIEELNAMRDAYVKERKAWQELGKKYKVAQLDEQIASAEAALKSAQEAKAQAYKDKEAIDKSYTDTLLNIYKQESANERAEANNKARQRAAAARASGGGNSSNSDIDHEIVNWWTSMFPDMYTDTRTSRRQATSPAGTPIADQYIDSTVTERRNLSKEEKAEITRKAKPLYDYYRKHPSNEALNVIKSFIGGGKSIEETHNTLIKMEEIANVGKELELTEEKLENTMSKYGIDDTLVILRDYQTAKKDRGWLTFDNFLLQAGL